MAETTVLLIAGDPSVRGRIAGWLEADGREVMACPGPRAPGSCVGLVDARCPLASGADAIVLDMALPHPRGAGPLLARRILALYLTLGRPVVAIGETGSPVAPPSGGFLVPMAPGPDHLQLTEAVEGALGRGTARANGRAAGPGERGPFGTPVLPPWWG